MLLLRTAAAALALVALWGCSAPDAGRPSAARERAQPPTASAEAAPARDRAAPARRKLVDPRADGLEVTLGEWAVTPEAKAIRPGTVTFVVRNRGTMGHGFEIELEGDSSGPGPGDLFKAETELLQPGESTRMTVRLGPGVYKIECLVDGHDDMGMEGLLDVRADAPRKPVTTRADANRVSISGFAFDPASLTVEAGTEVTWTNDDPTPHTVTGDGAFGSDTLDTGATFAFRFDQPGAYEYRCAIHPEMQGTVRVR